MTLQGIQHGQPDQGDLMYALHDDPLRWPLLTRATQGRLHKATSTKVEWLVEYMIPCYGCGQQRSVHQAEYNYQQIFREPFKKMSEAREAVHRLFDRIENALREGIRNPSRAPGACFPDMEMSSVLSLLGRWPTKDDEVTLSVLRPLTLRAITNDRYGVPFDHPTYEFLIECSVIAKKGPTA